MYRENLPNPSPDDSSEHNPAEVPSADHPATPAGWYDSPYRTGEIAWWSGTEWYEDSSQPAPQKPSTTGSPFFDQMIAAAEQQRRHRGNIGVRGKPAKEAPRSLLLFGIVWTAFCLLFSLAVISATPGEPQIALVLFISLFLYAGGFISTLGYVEMKRQGREKGHGKKQGKEEKKVGVYFTGVLNSSSAETPPHSMSPESAVRDGHGKKKVLLAAAVFLPLAGVSIMVAGSGMFGIARYAVFFFGTIVFLAGAGSLALAYPSTVEHVRIGKTGR